ncbi:MAG TPA: hypothetical protein VGB57_08895 [Allosphingosinicella sp.]|jgi:hypothetical protein
MLKRLKTAALAASLTLAGGAIFGTAASAQYTYPYPYLSSPCWDQVMSDCEVKWQAWGLTSYSDCGPMEACQVCPGTDGNNCPTINWVDNNEVSRHDSHGH